MCFQYYFGQPTPLAACLCFHVSTTHVLSFVVTADSPSAQLYVTGLNEPLASSPYPKCPALPGFSSFGSSELVSPLSRCPQLDTINPTDLVGAVIDALLAGALVVGALVLVVLFSTSRLMTPILFRSRYPAAAATGSASFRVAPRYHEVPELPIAAQHPQPR